MNLEFTSEQLAEIEAPSEFALSKARQFIEEFQRLGENPQVMPSAEGGVGIGFVNGRRRGSIEILNTGEMVAATYEGREAPLVWEFSDTPAEVRNAALRIAEYIKVLAVK